MSYIDLSQSLSHLMPVYPGDTSVELLAVERGGISNHILSCTMHTGTHIDSPGHMIPGGKKLSDYPVSKFFATGILIDARGKKLIGKELLQQVVLTADSCVLILTGYSDLFYTKEYFESYPALTEEFAQAMINSKVSMIGVDTPSPDYPPFAIHKLLLPHDILIIENLKLSELSTIGTARFDVIALPLKVESDGALARVVARI